MDTTSQERSTNMKKRISRISLVAGLLAALAVMAPRPRAEASSHREALATVNDPCIDNTDVYAWVTPGDHGKLYLISGYAGLHEPGQGNQQARLCDDVLYEFHIARGTADLDDDLTYQIQFFSTTPRQFEKGKTCTKDDGSPDLINCGNELLIQQSGVRQYYKVTKVEYPNGPGGAPVSTVITDENNPPEVTPPNVGPRTDRLVYLQRYPGRLQDDGLGFKPYTNNAAELADTQRSNEEGLYCKNNDGFARSFIAPLGNGGSEGRSWMGTRDDAYYLDEKGIFDVLNLGKGALPIGGSLPDGYSSIGARRTRGEDVFDGFNLNVLALEIPTTKILGTSSIPHNGQPGNDSLIGVWASASRRRDRRYEPNQDSTISCGPWVQVGREGLPLVNAGLIGTQDQGLYLRTQPKNDVANFGAYFLRPVLVRDEEALGTYAALGVGGNTLATLKGDRFDIIDTINLKNIPAPGAHDVPLSATGDVLRVDVATDSAFPNGRRLTPGGNRETVDVSDTTITLIVTGGALHVGDDVDYQDGTYLDQFPWHACPHQGLTEGHGAVNVDNP
jgi:hypothetical protein